MSIKGLERRTRRRKTPRSVTLYFNVLLKKLKQEGKRYETNKEIFNSDAGYDNGG